MLSAELGALRKLWIFRARAEHGRLASELAWMESQGFERVSADPSTLLLPDGREVVHAMGRAWSLRIDVHTARLTAALKNGHKAHRQVPGEALASVLCPACQSTMAKSPVCPNCAKGKAGFKILCICTECSHEVYL